MKYFVIKQRENKEVIACLKFNDINAERDLIVNFVADMLQVQVEKVDVTVALLTMTYNKANKKVRAGKNDWYLELEHNKLYVCRITKESYIEEDPNQDFE